MFVPTVPLLEMFVRGSIVYLSLFLLFRVVLKRQAGNVAITDLLVVVLVADAAQNAMSTDYKSIPDGMALVGTIVFWSYALDWAAYYWPRLGRLIHPPPLELIKEGKILGHNLRHELITREELAEQLREQGIEDIREVHRAYMEGDGKISVVKRSAAARARPRARA